MIRKSLICQNTNIQTFKPNLNQSASSDLWTRNGAELRRMTGECEERSSCSAPSWRQYARAKPQPQRNAVAWPHLSREAFSMIQARHLQRPPSLPPLPTWIATRQHTATSAHRLALIASSRNSMLLSHDAHHSLEQALAEADGRVLEQDEQRLRRANVSPVFSSRKAPHELTRLGSGISAPPLQLELSGSFADSANAKSLSRASSWHDFSLLSDAGEFQRAASSSDLLSSFDTSVTSTTDTWDAILEETKAPGGIPLAFALKTPTNDAFPGFFEREDVHREEPVLSPTHMDRKVLVTDNDLRLAPSMDAYSMLSHGTGTRAKREKLFPQASPEYHVAPMKRSHTEAFYSQNGEPRRLRRLPELSHAAGHYVLVPVDEHHEWQRLYAHGRGRVIPMTPTGPPLRPKTSCRKRKIGIYTPEARKERLRRFHEKRKQRVFHKRVKYDCRKRLANACPRIKGRFVSKEEFEEAMTAESSSSTCSEGSPDV